MSITRIGKSIPREASRAQTASFDDELSVWIKSERIGRSFRYLPVMAPLDGFEKVAETGLLDSNFASITFSFAISCSFATIVVVCACCGGSDKAQARKTDKSADKEKKSPAEDEKEEGGCDQNSKSEIPQTKCELPLAPKKKQRPITWGKLEMLEADRSPGNKAAGKAANKRKSPKVPASLCLLYPCPCTERNFSCCRSSRRKLRPATQ